MNKLFSILAAAIFMVAIGFTGVSSSFADGHEEAQMKEAAKDKMGMDDEMMKKWMEYATPNENHKVLDSFVGEWNYIMKWWMAPGTEPEKSAGTSKVKWILDGRFIKHKAEGTSMGQPFHGMGIVGYNNETKNYESVWIDNMGTGMVKGSGSYDAETKTITDTGTFSCPGEGDKKFRSVTKILGKDSYSFEWHMPGPDGKEYRAMVIDYTRKK